MTAGLATLRYLRANRSEVYGGLERSGETLRAGIDRALANGGVDAHTTGMGSLFLTHFGPAPRNAEESAGEDTERSRAYALFMMANGDFLLPGHAGGISTAHTDEDLQRRVSLSGKFAESKKSRK